MERAQSDESGQRCGGSVPLLGARHEHKWRLGDAGEIIGCRWNRLVPLPVMVSVPAVLLPPEPYH